MLETMEYPAKELRVKKSEQKPPMSFNEWSEKFGVSSKYIEPTKYFQGNPSSGIPPLKVESPIEKFFKMFTNR